MQVIQTGRVKINGQVINEPSVDVSGSEDITVDDRKVMAQDYTYVMLHKPPGTTTTKEDPHAEQTVLDLLPEHLHHLSPVGRLDRDSQGLLLLTNDGALAYRLTHPKFHLDKTYLVRVKGRLSKDHQKELQQGVVIEDHKTAPCRITAVRYNGEITEFHITLHEGRKRQIRLMLKSVGHQVHFLARISIGPLRLGDLKIGQWRYLTDEELKALRMTKQ